MRVGPEATEAALLDLSGVDYVVFYGHGDAVSLGAQPSRHTIPGGPNFLDVTTVRVLAGRPTYAVACEALRVLGTVYGALFPTGAFIGYDGPFTFNVSSQVEFEAVVASGAVLLLDGASRGEMVS
jgi:hypothetical protein